MYPGANDRQQMVMAGILALLAFMLLSGAAYGRDCRNPKTLAGKLSATPAEPDVENCLSWIHMTDTAAVKKAGVYKKACDAEPGCTDRNTTCAFEPTGKDGEYKWTVVLKCEDEVQLAREARVTPEAAPRAEWAAK